METPITSTLPILCLMGPTASGKSAAALRLAQEFPLEIINVDSATLYRGMDIGTAKPSVTEQALTPQHLLDLLDPSESFSVGKFTELTQTLIKAIHERGNIPLLAGGTMMYFKALLDGLDDLPSSDPAIRARLYEEGLALGWPALHERLAQVDPITAQRLSPMDSQRLQRALEVYELTGTPMSALLGQAKKPSGHFIRIGLVPQNRQALHQRIEQRFDEMLKLGFEQEVRALFERGDLHPDLPSIRCVGYRQMWQYLNNEVDFSTMRDMAIAATRQLAKRQITWLRSMELDIQIDSFANEALDVLMSAVRQALTPHK